MSRSTIALTKFVGCISLGLLTGTSYTLTLLTLPPLLHLPSAPTAQSSFLSLRASAQTHQRILSAMTLTSLALTYCLSPRKGRHPYLVWTALVVGLSGGVEWLVGDGEGDALGAGKGHRDREVGRGGDRVYEVGNAGGGGGYAAKRNNNDEEGVNGEKVREGMERWRSAQGVRGCVAGLGWVMCLVGIWGDGF